VSNKPFNIQAHERLTDGRNAYAELLGNLIEAQKLPGTSDSPEDIGANVIGNAVTELLGLKENRRHGLAHDIFL